MSRAAQHQPSRRPRGVASRHLDLATLSERELLIHLVRTVNHMEDRMPQLDDVVNAITAIAGEIETEVADLREQVAASAADDADVEAQVSNLEGLAARLRAVAEPSTPDAPPADNGGDVTPPADNGGDVPPVDGGDVPPVDGGDTPTV